MDTQTWPRVAVMGAGAVGCYFGGMLARAGAPVTLIARAPHVDAIVRDGLRIESLHFDEHVPIAASTDVDAVRDAHIVFVSVKTPDTETAAQAMAPHLAADAVIVSLQNGVDNAARIRLHLRQEVVPAVVYVAAEMVGPGHIRHTGRGDLIVGREIAAPVETRMGLSEVSALLGRAGVPCRVSAHVDADLWEKLTMNCAFNGMSALTRMKYGPLVADAHGRSVLEPLVREVVAVARASGVPLEDEEMLAAAYRLAAAMPEATSSTAQDIARGRRTEIDQLNGLVSRRGEALGVPTPVNRTVHALVKLLEAVGTP
jgi:2-dehydropantoate 2-reductase